MTPPAPLSANPARSVRDSIVRAVIQEILTAHFFVTTPGYLERMLKLSQIQLRI